MRRARRLEQLGVLKVATHINGDLPRLLDFTPAPTTLDLDGAARTARPPMSDGLKALRPYVLRQWPALLGATAAHRGDRRRRAGQAVAAGADRRPPDRRPQGALHVDVALLLGVGALILAIAVAESAATYFSDLWMQSAGERITHELRVAIYDHLQRLSLAFHQRTHKGDLLTRVTEDVNDMGELFSDTLGEMLQSALLAVGMTIVLLCIDPVLALLSLRPRRCSSRSASSSAARCASAPAASATRRAISPSVANEALSAMQVVKAFGAEDHGVRARSAAAASSGWASASRSRGCRRASTAPSASCAPSRRRS